MFQASIDWVLITSADGDRSYAGQVRQYVAGLKRLVEQLREAAKDYKVSEEEKAAVFGDRGKHGA